MSADTWIILFYLRLARFMLGEQRRGNLPRFVKQRNRKNNRLLSGLTKKINRLTLIAIPTRMDITLLYSTVRHFF